MKTNISSFVIIFLCLGLNQSFAQAGLDWQLLGNAGTNPAINFVGTTDNNALSFRTNNVNRMRLTTNSELNLINGASAYQIGGQNILWHNNIPSSIFVGVGAGASALSPFALRNTFVGNNAGTLVTTQVDNTIIGYNAGSAGIGNQNTFVGSRAGENNNTFGNTYIGFMAGNANVGGQRNVSVGFEAGVNSSLD